MGVLNLGMSIMGIDQNLQKVVKGMVLLAAVIFDVVSKRKSFIVASFFDNGRDKKHIQDIYRTGYGSENCLRNSKRA